MPITKRTIAAALGLVLLSVATINAQPPAKTKNGPPSQLLILSATADRATETLTIRGQHLGGGAAFVFVEEFLMSVTSASDDRLVIHLPAGVPDGTYLLTVTRGPSPHDRDVFHFAVQSARTVEGPQGPVGPQGEPGPVGPQGEPGAVGAQGAPGAAGPQGPAGSQGEQGAQGATGAAGPQGAPGPQGEPGPAGPVGPQGATGPAGPAGAQGDMGPMGPAGAPGAAGPMGPVGPQGDAGPAGPQGSQGEAGAMGPAGPQGPAGAAGATGATGPMGLMGPMGPMGPQGEPGPSGVAGVELIPVVMTVPAIGVNGQGTLMGTASCPVGKRVLSGGPEVSWTSSGTGALVVVSSFAVSETSWRVVMRNPSTTAVSGISLRIHLVCADF